WRGRAIAKVPSFSSFPGNVRNICRDAGAPSGRFVASRGPKRQRSEGRNRRTVWRDKTETPSARLALPEGAARHVAEQGHVGVVGDPVLADPMARQRHARAAGTLVRG